MFKQPDNERTNTVLKNHVQSVSKNMFCSLVVLTTHERHDMFVYFSPSSM